MKLWNSPGYKSQKKALYKMAKRFPAMLRALMIETIKAKDEEEMNRMYRKWEICLDILKKRKRAKKKHARYLTRHGIIPSRVQRRADWDSERITV